MGRGDGHGTRSKTKWDGQSSVPDGPVRWHLVTSA
jgi:hypothetical protein